MEKQKKEENKKDNIITWEEEFGCGYPIDEKTYKKFKEKHKKRKLL